MYFLEMDSSIQYEEHSPLKDLSSTTNTSNIDQLLSTYVHLTSYYATKYKLCYFLAGDNIHNDSGAMTSGDQSALTNPKERKRQRERDRYAQLSDQQKDELLKKCREARGRKKVMQGDMGSYEKFSEGELQCTPKQSEASRANARAHYANSAPEQRQAIRDRQRILYANMTSKQKYAKKNREKARHAIRSNAPSKNSIAMINPLYNSSYSD
jgi:hypothetical protein